MFKTLVKLTRVGKTTVENVRLSKTAKSDFVRSSPYFSDSEKFNALNQKKSRKESGLKKGTEHSDIKTLEEPSTSGIIERQAPLSTLPEDNTLAAKVTGFSDIQTLQESGTTTIKDRKVTLSNLMVDTHTVKVAEFSGVNALKMSANTNNQDKKAPLIQQRNKSLKIKKKA